MDWYRFLSSHRVRMAQESCSAICLLFRVWKPWAQKTCFPPRWNWEEKAQEIVPPPVFSYPSWVFGEFKLPWPSCLDVIPKTALSVSPSNHPHSLVFTEVESLLSEEQRDPRLPPKGQFLTPGMGTVVVSERREDRWAGTAAREENTFPQLGWCSSSPVCSQGMSPGLCPPQGFGCRGALHRQSFSLDKGSSSCLGQGREILSSCSWRGARGKTSPWCTQRGQKKLQREEIGKGCYHPNHHWVLQFQPN